MYTEKLNFLAFIIPLFLILMVLEYGYSLKKQKRFYSFDESISNLNVGIVERMCDMFSVSLFYFFSFGCIKILRYFTLKLMFGPGLYFSYLQIFSGIGIIAIAMK